jgi:hypothetical protein
MLDFKGARERHQSMSELAQGLTVADLHRLTDEMIDAELRLVADATNADVVFQPEDPAANDTFAANAQDVNIAWTLGHVIVHATASSEEAAAQATELARGVEVKGRSRYETPWQTVTTIAQVRARLEESRRMRHALLNVWPDPPHLDITYTAGYPGATPVNALARFISGLGHDDSHLGQIAEIMRQVREARGSH